MSDNKTYYYIRLRDKFFDDDKITLLESMPDGILYSNILLKMYLKSLKFNGMLRLTDEIAYTSEMLATITRHQVGTVEKALHMLKQLGLVEVLTDGAFYMTNIQELIGKSSTEGDRKRAARNSLQERGLLSGQMSDKRPPEIRVQSLDIKNPPISPQGESVQSSESLTVQTADGAGTPVHHSMTLTESFETFWEEYPRKQGKAAAEKIWQKICPAPELLSSMLAAIASAKKSEQWKRDKGRYIPAPAKWLSQRRWEDKLGAYDLNPTHASYDLADMEAIINSPLSE